MTEYKYDENLPYVVVTEGGNVLARFHYATEAGRYAVPPSRIIDTTPKPRVPADAKFITYQGRSGLRFYARRALNGLWIDHDDDLAGEDVQSLPCVTPDTVFTVLDARDERSNT